MLKKYSNASKYTKQQKGLTLIEIMIVILIAGAIILGSFAVAKSGNQTSVIVTLENDIKLLYLAATSFKRTGGAYTDASIVNAVADGVLDQSYGNGTGVNPHGGNYTMTPVAGNRIAIAATGLTSESCSAIARKFSPRAYSSVCAGTTVTITFN